MLLSRVDIAASASSSRIEMDPNLLVRLFAVLQTLQQPFEGSQFPSVHGLLPNGSFLCVRVRPRQCARRDNARSCSSRRLDVCASRMRRSGA